LAVNTLGEAIAAYYGSKAAGAKAESSIETDSKGG
jgi:hypothetical protein